jgi:hypothetical protein
MPTAPLERDEGERERDEEEGQSDGAELRERLEVEAVGVANAHR